MAVGGSVNLRSTLDRQGKLSLINDLHVEPLPPFSDAEVADFVQTMLQTRQVPFQPEIIDRVKELLGTPIPFFLQLLAQELYRDWRTHHEPLEPRHVDSVFQRVLMGEVARDKFQHFYSRIATHYVDSERQAARELLDLLSRNDKPLTRNALLAAYRGVVEREPQQRTAQDTKQAFYDLMLLLHNDFYVEEIGDLHYDFASRTLKLWWRKYYG